MFRGYEVTRSMFIALYRGLVYNAFNNKLSGGQFENKDFFTLFKVDIFIEITLGLAKRVVIFHLFSWRQTGWRVRYE